MHRQMTAFSLVILSSIHFSHAQDASELKPLMAVPDQLLIDADFDKPMDLPKATWTQRQGTRWAAEEGVLRGRESSKEYQAKREHHYGYEARLSLPTTPAEFVCKVSFRFLNGEETAIVPFIEFGHHVCRVRFSKDGTTLISDGETMKLAEDKTFVFEDGKWYHALAEMKGKEFVIQFAGGPTFYAERDAFAEPARSGDNGFGIAGPKHGTVELDNLSLSSIKPNTQNGWEKRKQGLPKSEPVQIKEPKKK